MDAKVLRFTAIWCQPCKALAETIKDADIKLPIEVVDVDKEPTRAMQYQIRSVPTLIVVDEDGEELRRQTGAMTLSQFEHFVNNV